MHPAETDNLAGQKGTPKETLAAAKRSLPAPGLFSVSLCQLQGCSLFGLLWRLAGGSTLSTGILVFALVTATTLDSNHGIVCNGLTVTAHFTAATSLCFCHGGY